MKAHELEQLLAWTWKGKAELLELSSTGLTGLAASLQATLGVPVLDSLPVALREAVRRVRFRS